MVNSGWSNSTGWLFSTCTAFSVPDAVAVTGFITFIASMIRIVSPAFTAEPTVAKLGALGSGARRSEEQTYELQSLMRISSAVFCLQKKKIHLQSKTYYYIHTDTI